MGRKLLQNGTRSVVRFETLLVSLVPSAVGTGGHCMLNHYFDPLNCSVRLFRNVTPSTSHYGGRRDHSRRGPGPLLKVIEGWDSLHLRLRQITTVSGIGSQISVTPLRNLSLPSYLVVFVTGGRWEDFSQESLRNLRSGRRPTPGDLCPIRSPRRGEMSREEGTGEEVSDCLGVRVEKGWVRRKVSF